MDLRKLLSTIIDSSREDWNFIAGETFHNTFGIEGPPKMLHAYAHKGTAVYIPNVAISMEFGLEWRDNYKAKWIETFPDHHASGQYLDVFFNHALVYRTAYVYVDGGRHKLPLPNNDVDLKVEKGHCDLIKVIDRMAVAQRTDYDPFDGALRQAGFTIVNEEWPRFMH
jgi:hypothetical protein